MSGKLFCGMVSFGLAFIIFVMLLLGGAYIELTCGWLIYVLYALDAIYAAASLALLWKACADAGEARFNAKWDRIEAERAANADGARPDGANAEVAEMSVKATDGEEPNS